MNTRRKHNLKEGDVYGYFTVICEEETKTLKSGKKDRMVKCRCVCGKIMSMRVGNLVNRESSCGCKGNYGINLYKHGLRKHPLYAVWSSLKDRTTDNPNYEFYKYYYGKGVRICEEWLLDFMSFYNWAIANGYKKGLQLDKDIIPMKLGIPPLLYSPEMCCFVTPRENCNSRRNSDFIEYNGEKMTTTELARKVGIKQTTLWRRIHISKMPVEKAILPISYLNKKWK